MYVGVTAEQVGVTGGARLPIPGYNPKGLRDQNPARYQSLHHPGDDYSYDIFSQAAQAILHPDGVKPLGSLRPAHLIAAGESQSASRLVTYVDAVQPIANIYDGFLIHSRGPSGTNLNSGPTGSVPKIVHIRSDLRVPVLILATETDLTGLHFYEALQPDTDRLHTWQMAGTAHVDQSTLDYGVASGRQWDKTSVIPDFTKLCGSLNDGPERYIVRAAFAALSAWVVNGKPPPPSPAIKVIDNGSEIARDAHGNATRRNSDAGRRRAGRVAVGRERGEQRDLLALRLAAAVLGRDAEAALPGARRLRDQGQGIGRGRGEGRVPAAAGRRRDRSAGAGRAGPERVMSDVDELADEWMEQALAEARAAIGHDDVPVGAIVVHRSTGNRCGARHNERERSSDPTAHAELLALRAAAAAEGSWRLDDHALVVTLEPCPMCAGAVWAARVPCSCTARPTPKQAPLAASTTSRPIRVSTTRRRSWPAYGPRECGALLSSFFASRR